MRLVTKKALFCLATSASIFVGVTPALAATTYTTKASDTFWSMSQKFGVSTSALENANPSISSNDVYEGLTIHIPKSNQAVHSYIVQPQDTFWNISQRRGVSFNKLVAANANVNPLDLIPGQVIAWPSSTSAARTPSPLQASSIKTNSVNERIFDYSRKIDLVATAYTTTDNGAYGAVDYFGSPLKLGDVAVDPKVIPLGSQLWITGYNYAGLPQGGMLARAVDEGGAILGNRVDIYVPQTDAQAENFGMQNVKVYVLN